MEPPSPAPLTVGPLPADAEAQQLEQELRWLSARVEELLAEVRAARGAFAEVEAEPIDVAALPDDLGDGSAGREWREGQMAAAQAELRAACRPAREHVDAVRQALSAHRTRSLARMRLLELLDRRPRDLESDEAETANNIIEAFDAEFREFAGRILLAATRRALAVWRAPAGRPKKGTHHRPKWEVLADWVQPLGRIDSASLEKEYQRWRSDPRGWQPERLPHTRTSHCRTCTCAAEDADSLRVSDE